MDKNKKWDRKEVVTVDPGSLKCFKSGVNPIHYNQGVCYVGSNSLKILLQNIDKI